MIFVRLSTGSGFTLTLSTGGIIFLYGAGSSFTPGMLSFQMPTRVVSVNSGGNLVIGS